jgi:hypothetical protein
MQLCSAAPHSDTGIAAEVEGVRQHSKHGTRRHQLNRDCLPASSSHRRGSGKDTMVGTFHPKQFGAALPTWQFNDIATQRHSDDIEAKKR